MKPKTLFFLFFFISLKSIAQHQVKMGVYVFDYENMVKVHQYINYHNQTNDTLKTIVLNDWNNAYSSKKSPLAQRFSDEFVRSFQLSTEQERGKTVISFIGEGSGYPFKEIKWKRPENHLDLIELELEKPILPNEKFGFQIDYQLKIPSSKFTGVGIDDKGNINLKDCFLSIARYENHTFVKNSNVNIDDNSNAIANYEIHIQLFDNFKLTTDLNVDENDKDSYNLSGNSRSNFSLYLQPKLDFYNYKYDDIEIITNIKSSKIDDLKKALIIEKINSFVTDNLGKYPYQKITISQDDYDRNPFYGLNQLPSFLNPFPDDYIYELKFLKTYLNNYLHNSIHINSRKDNWIFDGIQVFYMMKYIDENYPSAKMMGSIAKLKILKSFHLVNLDFNEQYSYFYMIMARLNIDQPIGDSKDSFIRFNEKIAGKYRAGLSFKYLDAYLENGILQKSITQFIALNKDKQTRDLDFENILKTNAGKNIDWFFETIVDSRKIIDYKFKNVVKANDSITFTIKNKTNAVVPIPVYGLKNNQIIFKKWFENIKTDSTFSIKNTDADKLVLNLNNEVPEFNLRNNFKKLDGFFPNNRPIKFAFMKDLEDPKYNQILYVPTFNYNLYDGFIAGMSFHNSTMLNKPFYFNFEPLYGTKSQSLTGGISFSYNQIIREGSLYNIRYGLFGSTAHFAPDASYTKFNPVVSFSFRDKDFRKNEKQYLMFRHILLNRQKSNYVSTENSEDYSIFNARFGSGKNELTHQFSYNTDVQIADKFGKISANIGYRKMFDDNRQISFRAYAGAFLYNKSNSNFFSFALDRPTDYLFDYDYLGRSESTGLFSQQLIIAEGGFKTKMSNSFANQWITSVNAGASIWNWVEVYGDAAVFQNQNNDPKFLYDSGIRLNFVQDYFELYFPVYSSNGWDVSSNYNQKIRFIFTISTNTIVSLFTRKWF